MSLQLKSEFQKQLNYLLDTDNTSELDFQEFIDQNISHQNELFHELNVPIFEQVINEKLDELKSNTNQKQADVNRSVDTKKHHGIVDRQENESDSEDSCSTTSDEEEGDNIENLAQSVTKKMVLPKTSTEHNTRPKTKPTGITTNNTDPDLDQELLPSSQIERLLRLLFYLFEKYQYFSNIYFQALSKCLEYEQMDRYLVHAALEQLCSQLSQTDNCEKTSAIHDKEQQRKLIEIAQRTVDKYSTSELLPLTRKVLTTVESLFNQCDSSSSLLDFSLLDVLYSFRSRWLKVDSEFRDCTQYFIDGDSLLFTVIQYSNVNLNEYYGNTLHVIYIIERLLSTLFSQSNDMNYYIIFFNDVKQIISNNMSSSTFYLLRQCFIQHIQSNMNEEKMNCSRKLRQFNSFLSEDYIQFYKEEKPYFVLYNDITTTNSSLLLTDCQIEYLRLYYRYFSNYHYFSVKCGLYLMNNIKFIDTSIWCFKVSFDKRISSNQIQQQLQKMILRGQEEAMEFSETYSLIIVTVLKKYCDKDLLQKAEVKDVRLHLYQVALMVMYETTKNDKIQSLLLKRLLPFFCLHISLLIRLSITDRHLPSFSTVTFSPAVSQQIYLFQKLLTFILSPIISVPSYCSLEKISDMFDGRLFAFTIWSLITSKNNNFSIDSETLKIFQSILHSMNDSHDTPSNVQLLTDNLTNLIESGDIQCSSEVPSVSLSLQNNRRILSKISNPFIENYIKPFLSSPTTSQNIDFMEPIDSSAMEYEGNYHWHVLKPCGTEIERIKDDRERKQKKKRYRTKDDQENAAYFTNLGNSLTTKDIKDTQLEIALYGQALSIDDREETAKRSRKEQKILDDKIKEDENKKKEKELADMLMTDTLLQQKNNNRDRIEVYDKFLFPTVSSPIQTPLNRLKLFKNKIEYEQKYLRQLLTSSAREDTKYELEQLRIKYFETLTWITYLEGSFDYCETCAEPLISKKIKEKHDNCRRTKQTNHPLHLKQDHMRNILLLSSSGNDDIDINESWYRFQMETINSQLPRVQNTKKDKRVPSFIPDKWQVQFLNAVDDKQSIIILAPTASGKTYASEYAMKQTSENGLCIYVSPTKALVNQVAATVYIRLRAHVGFFTRDFRRDIDVCKVLVTVPQCLEILLLSPNHQKLRNKLEYVIFDEIHCMGTELGGDVWEKCMLMCNAPMIGLSATVSNGEEIHNWWTRIERRRSELYMKPERHVEIIRYNERLADLNKYLYSGKELYPMHPIAIMNSKQLIERGNLPVDLSLSPKETLQLHDAIQDTLYTTMISDGQNNEELSIITTTTTESKRFSSPLVNHFGDDWTVERTKCNKFSEHVLQQFTTMIEKNEIQKIDSVIQNIKKGEEKFEYPETKHSSQLIVEFISMLRDRNLLPCIVFSDARWLCEKNATTVVQYLEREEEKLRSGKYKQRMDEIERKLEEIERKKKKSEKRSASKKKKSNASNRKEEEYTDDDDVNNGLNGVDSDFYYKHLPECTLVHRQADKNIVDTFMKDAAKSNPELVKLMKRGVAYHHSGLNAKGRVAVEALFRNRHIQVVFATSTLALGIHMPTKTVAFVRDSIHLDALNYRQESGRSGRRGFDVQGHVVFVDIPLSKIRHLTISRIPDITASFPTSITFLMRLLHLYKMSKGENNKIDSCNRALILMECSFMSTLSQKKQILADVQLHYHFLYSLELLYQLHLVNGEGNLVGIAGLVTHLYYYEPGNILLGYLINEGLFHTTESVIDIVIILAFMFTNQPWHVTPIQRTNLLLERTEKKYSSTLFLPLMSKRFIQTVDAYNQIVENVYICYIQDVIKILREKLPMEECILPVSNISFYEKSDYDDGTFEYKLKHHYTQQPNSAISPFAGLSGLTDEKFMHNYNSTSYDLAFNIDLSNKIVPFMDLHDYNKMNLNSYALDFYINGSKRQLIVESQLQAGDIFDFSQDFLLLLASIKTSLQAIVKHEKEQTATVTDLNFFQTIFNKFDEIHHNYKVSFNKAFPHRKYRI